MSFSQLRELQRRGLTRDQARDALIEQKLEIDDIEKQLKIYTLLLLWGKARKLVAITVLLLLLIYGTLWYQNWNDEQHRIELIASNDFDKILSYSLEENDFELCLSAANPELPIQRFVCTYYHAAKRQSPELCEQYLVEDELTHCYQFVQFTRDRPGCADPRVSLDAC